MVSPSQVTELVRSSLALFPPHHFPAPADNLHCLTLPFATSQDVAKLAGVPDPVVTRADDISSLFKAELDAKLAAKRRSALPLVAHADFAFLFKLGMGQETKSRGGAHSLALLRDAVGKYERSG
jgi:hypothetical protein